MTATTASAGRTRAANQAPNPACSTVRPGEHDGEDRDRPGDGCGAHKRRTRYQSPSGGCKAGKCGHLGGEHEDECHGAARADRRVLPGALRARRIGRQEGIGSVGKPIEMERPGQDRHRRDREQAGKGGLGRAKEREGHEPDQTDEDPDDREGRRAARHLVGRSDRQPGQQRQRGAQRPADPGGRPDRDGRAWRDRDGHVTPPRPAGGHGPDRHRRPRGYARRRACSQAARRRRSDRRSSGRRAGRSWRPGRGRGGRR